MWWSHDSTWGWLWMSVMMVAFWAFVAFAIVLVVRALKNPHDDSSAAPRSQSPQDILAERYARGEIDADDYQHRLHDIESHVAHR